MTELEKIAQKYLQNFLSNKIGEKYILFFISVLC